jgi:hypothetical protein
MTAARGDGGRRHPPVKQVRFMGAAQILELEIGEAESSGLAHKSFAVLRGLRSRVNEKPSPDSGGFGNISASAGSFTSDRSTGGAVGNAGDNPQMSVTLGNEEGEQVIINRDRALVDFPFRTLEPQQISFGLLNRALDRASFSKRRYLRTEAPRLRCAWRQ